MTDKKDEAPKGDQSDGDPALDATTPDGSDPTRDAQPDLVIEGDAPGAVDVRGDVVEPGEEPDVERPTLALEPDEPGAVDHLPEPAPAPGRTGKKGKKGSLDGEATTIAPEENEVPRPKRGESVVMYQGLADLIEFEDYRFRPGQPVIVRSDAVDELLTMPNEQFVEVKE